jgi:hypothetical protein
VPISVIWVRESWYVDDFIGSFLADKYPEFVTIEDPETR